MNHVLLGTFGRMLDNYALTRTISGRGFYILRHFGLARGFMMMSVVTFFLTPFFFADMVKVT